MARYSFTDVWEYTYTVEADTVERARGLAAEVDSLYEGDGTFIRTVENGEVDDLTNPR